MGALYLVRHGQASFGQANYDQLSKIGHEHSAVLGRHLKAQGLNIDRVVCGGMKRHAQTADECLGAMGYDGERTIDTGFDEYDHQEVLTRFTPAFAEPAGLAAALARASNPRATFQKHFSDAVQRWVGGNFDEDYRESWPQFKQRCVASAEAAAAAGGTGHNTVIFTSGGAISVIVAHALRLDDRTAFELNWIIANTSVTRLIYGKDRLTLSYFNNFSHVEGDERLLTYR